MAEQKKATVKSKSANDKKGESTSSGKEPAKYVFQPFSSKAVALIHKYNLQTDENYKRLISSFERINPLPKQDPRKSDLVEMWELEFNRLFKDFWEKYTVGMAKQKTSGIEGWKNRLDVKKEEVSPSAKRQDIMARLSPGTGINKNANSREQILERAGFQQNSRTGVFNFSAEGKGTKLSELENLLDIAENNGVLEPESMLSNRKQPSPFSSYSPKNVEDEIEIEEENTLFGSKAKSTQFNSSESNSTLYDENGNIIRTNEDEPGDPYLKEFVEGNSSYSESLKSSSGEGERVVFRDIPEENTNKSVPYADNGSLKDMQKPSEVINFKEAAYIMQKEEIEKSKTSKKSINDYEAYLQEKEKTLELESGTTKKYDAIESDIFNGDLLKVLSGESEIVSSSDTEYSSKSELIAPDKRNILSKEGFEYAPKEELAVAPQKTSKFSIDSEEGSKPYHEIKPIANYGISFDRSKRPSMNEIIEHNKNEDVVVDEIQNKVELLRDLRNERRHRINMMKIERANSYVVARARRLSELRDQKRIKKREELNYRTLERSEKLRRLQERQKLIGLMKERQMKRAEEKRISTVLRLERERRMERDAKYRSDIASIDAQIRHEQELIKRTELKMKAYFSKINDDKLFDESLKIARKNNIGNVMNEKIENMQKFEEDKRKNRIEKISKKFIKNVK